MLFFGNFRENIHRKIKNEVEFLENLYLSEFDLAREARCEKLNIFAKPKNKHCKTQEACEADDDDTPLVATGTCTTVASGTETADQSYSK